MVDITKQENKKYIPIGTFVLGCIVGAVAMHYWMQRKHGGSEKFASGGSVPQTIQIVNPAPVAQAPAPVVSAPAPSVAASGEAFVTPSI